MSNLLTGVIVLLIIIILADGFRRTYSARSNRIRVSPTLNKRAKEKETDYEDPEPVELLKRELPNGGARVIGHRDPSQAPRKEKKLSAKELREIRRREEAAKHTPEQTHLNLDASVPILMESVDQTESHHEYINERIEPSFSADSSAEHENALHYSEQHDDQDDAQQEIVHDQHEDEYEEEEWDEDEEGENDFEEDDYEDEDELDDEYASDTEGMPTNTVVQPEPEEVFIINIMAVKGEMFNGNDLLDAVLRNGLRYGNMDIFHRYSDTKGEGTLLFSMANMVKPGTFDLDAMDEFETPGVSLFMTLPIVGVDSMKSFELMLEAATSIADLLHGELKDDQRSIMTRQTIEHSRQRISDFERKKIFRRPR